MKFGIANLSIVPLRADKSDASEMISQVLFGEHFKVIDHQAKWSKIRLSHDKYEGWIDNKQFRFISEDFYKTLDKTSPEFCSNLVDFISDEKHELSTICLGSTLPMLEAGKMHMEDLNFSYEGEAISGKQSKENLITTAYMYLNAPYLWGGRSPFGIDCSGFTQMVYRINGYSILRDAYQQATQGEVLSFIEESEPGDLAFFDNEEGRIIHVGIIMKDNYIIHAHGKVRIDRIDHSGIFNADLNRHTHKLRVIKKII